MPEFANPFARNVLDRKLTRPELIRAVRYSVAIEYEAIQLFTQIAEATTNRLSQEVMREVAEEEVVHAGEFLGLLHLLAPEETGLYEKGRAEVEELLEKLRAKRATL